MPPGAMSPGAKPAAGLRRWSQVIGAEAEPIEVFASELLARWMTPDQVVKEADVDNSGEIDLEEFMDLCTTTLRLKLTAEQIADVFATVDVDKSGSCSVSEMKAALQVVVKKLEGELMAKSAPPADEGDLRKDTKLVALVAHNNMKPSMMAFVAKHRDFFKTVQIVTTGSTGASLEKKLGLKIARKVASGPLGGDQEIGGMISLGELDGVLFFRDPLSAHPHDDDIKALMRICDVHCIPTANNPASGKAVLFYLASLAAERAEALASGDETLESVIAARKNIPESDVVRDYKSNQKKVIATTVGK